MNLETIVLVKPKAFERMDKASIEGVIKADQRVFPLLENFIALGEKQIKTLTGYTHDNFPGKSPQRTDITLDGIQFDLLTNVRVTNPEYQSVFEKITGFLEVLVNDWRQGVRKDGVRTYSADVMKDGDMISQKAPFVKWDYLMWNVLWYISRKTNVGVTNQIENITAPPELSKMELERLILPANMLRKPDISDKGTAEVWYLAKRFFNEIQEATVEPYKEEMESRSGVSKESMPDATTIYLKQVSDYLAKLMSIPSPRRQPGKVITFLFEIPQKGKATGSTGLPVIPGPENDPKRLIRNYMELLEEYRGILPTSLKRWKNIEGKIGELVTFYYDIEEDPIVSKAFQFLPEYQVQRDGNNMYIHIEALHSRMAALENDYVKNRLLRKHTIEPIV